MNKAIFIAAVLGAVTLLYAQSMRVYTTDSSSPTVFDLSAIDSITFELPDTTAPNPGDLVYPADFLDLREWKITLPIGSSGSPTEIKQPDLATYKHDEYFHLTPAKSGVLFKAHCGGVTTSGSSYPRSELREMTNNGTDRASWSTTSGTHTMYIKQAITHIPDTKRHVVAGQIHDSDDDLIVFRLESTHLFIDHNGKDPTTLTRDYSPGDIFEAKFVAGDGKVAVYYNGVHQEDHPASKSGCYFKAGCYTQASSSKEYNGTYPSEDEYGEVVIYDLWVKHE